MSNNDVYKMCFPPSRRDSFPVWVVHAGFDSVGLPPHPVPQQEEVQPEPTPTNRTRSASVLTNILSVDIPRTNLHNVKVHCKYNVVLNYFGGNYYYY